MVIGDAEVAIEIKSSDNTRPSDSSGLRAFIQEHSQARPILVSLDPRPKTVNGIETLPATIFLKKLWSGEIIKP